jgi:hypothetical protein
MGRLALSIVNDSTATNSSRAALFRVPRSIIFKSALHGKSYTVPGLNRLRLGEQFDAVAAQNAFDLLMARVALLESALASPKTKTGSPRRPET